MSNTTLIDPFGRSEDDRKALAARNEEIDRFVVANWHDDNWRRSMAADLTETIYRGFEHENLLSLLSTVKNLGFQDRDHVKEIRGMRAYWVARGGYINASTVNAKVVEITRNTIGFHVYDFEDKIMTNFSETQSNLIQLGIERLDAEVNAYFLRTIQAAVPSSSPYYVATTDMALSDINTALTAVQDASRAGVVALVGRAPMVQKVIDKIMGTASNGSGFLPETNEQLIRTGVLGSYRGTTLVKLTNYLDDLDVPFVPANELYVVGVDASRCAFFGGLMSKEWTEDDADYWHYRARRDFGILIHRPDRLRRIVDSSITAFTTGS